MNLGHAAGDRVLVEVAGRLAQDMRASDTVARVGGDEFVVLLGDVHDEAAVIGVAERLRARVREPMGVAGRQVFLDASIGIAFGKPPRTRPSELLQNADAAMYAAKQRGRGHMVYDDQLRRHAGARLALEQDLRDALDRRDLRLHYQPTVDLPSGRIVGAEALVRMAGADGALIAPAQFIAVAEDTGLISVLGEQVLAAACDAAAGWARRTDARGDLSVAINVSARQVGDPELARQVEDHLARSGLPPERLGLEVTETAVMREMSVGIDALAALRALGVRVAIDDFGTGYSSLSALKQLPVDIQDRPVVRERPARSRRAGPRRGDVRHRTRPRLTVVAEGIETDEQLRRLRELGCDLGQGWHLGRPAALEVFEDHVLRTTAERRMEPT